MKKAEFIHQLADYCEFENQVLNLSTSLKSIEGFDSMSIMAIIAFVDEHFQIKLTSARLQGLSDFNSLISAIGESNFEDD